MLAFDDLLDATTAVGMGTGCYNGLIEVVQADWTRLLAFDLELQHVLQGFDILWCKRNDLMLLQGVQKLVDAILAQCPVVADLPETQDDLQQMGVLGVAVLVLEVKQSTLGFVSEFMVSIASWLCERLYLVRTGMLCTSPVREL